VRSQRWRNVSSKREADIFRKCAYESDVERNDKASCAGNPNHRGLLITLGTIAEDVSLRDIGFSDFIHRPDFS
jgi:hypothetical protein